MEVYLNITAQVLLIITLILIAIQDIKSRKVYVALFIAAGLLMAYFYFISAMPALIIVNVVVNTVAVMCIVATLYLYAKYKLKRNFNETLGMGDLVFWILLAWAFPTPTFLVLFVFSAIFSLFASLLIQSLKNKTVPLAGLQALFLSLVYVCNFTFLTINLYLP